MINPIRIVFFAAVCCSLCAMSPSHLFSATDGASSFDPGLVFLLQADYLSAGTNSLHDLAKALSDLSGSVARGSAGDKDLVRIVELIRGRQFWGNGLLDGKPADFWGDYDNLTFLSGWNMDQCRIFRKTALTPANLGLTDAKGGPARPWSDKKGWAPLLDSAGKAVKKEIARLELAISTLPYYASNFNIQRLGMTDQFSNIDILYSREHFRNYLLGTIGFLESLTADESRLLSSVIPGDGRTAADYYLASLDVLDRACAWDGWNNMFILDGHFANGTNLFSEPFRLVRTDCMDGTSGLEINGLATVQITAANSIQLAFLRGVDLTNSAAAAGNMVAYLQKAGLLLKDEKKRIADFFNSLDTNRLSSGYLDCALRDIPKIHAYRFSDKYYAQAGERLSGAIAEADALLKGFSELRGLYLVRTDTLGFTVSCMKSGSVSNATWGGIAGAGDAALLLQSELLRKMTAPVFLTASTNQAVLLDSENGGGLNGRLSSFTNAGTVPLGMDEFRSLAGFLLEPEPGAHGRRFSFNCDQPASANMALGKLDMALYYLRLQKLRLTGALLRLSFRDRFSAAAVKAGEFPGLLESAMQEIRYILAGCCGNSQTQDMRSMLFQSVIAPLCAEAIYQVDTFMVSGKPLFLKDKICGAGGEKAFATSDFIAFLLGLCGSGGGGDLSFVSPELANRELGSMDYWMVELKKIR